MAILELTSGRASSFTVKRRLPDAIDLKRLSAAIPQLVPAWDLPSNAPADAQLQVDEGTLLDLALRRFDGDTAPERIALYQPEGLPVPEKADDTSRPDAVPDLLFLRRAVVDPLLRARTGDVRWIRVAAAQADRLGLQISVDDELITMGPVQDKDPPRYTLWLRRVGGEPVVYEVRAARRHHLAAEVARTWWAGTGSFAILVHDAGADLDAQALQRASTRSPELSILRALVLDKPGATVVSVDAYREDEFPGADAVISIGRPLGSGDRVPAWIEPVRMLVEGSGGSVVWYDGDYQRIRFYDPSNPRAEVVRYAGGQYATVYLSPLFRERFATPDTSSALRSLLLGSRIELRDAVLDDLLAAPTADTADAAERHGSLLGSLARNAHTGHPGELDRLQRLAREQGMEVWAFLDRDDGLPYLVIEGHERRLVAALARASGELTDNPRDTAQVRLYGRTAALVMEPTP
jgi:hypothetical protein